MKGTLRKRCAAPSGLRRVGTEHSRTIHRPTPAEDEKAHVARQGNFIGSHSIVEKVDSLLAGDVHGSSPNTSRDLRQARIVTAVQHGFRDSGLQEIFPSLPDNPDGNGSAVVP